MRALMVSLAVASFGTACGGDPERKPSGPPMTSPQSRPTKPRAGNRPPVIRSVSLDPERPTGGAPVRAIVDATDPDGDLVRIDYAWKLNGRLLGRRSVEVDLADATKGDRLELVVRASDGHAESPPTEMSVRVANRPPTLSSIELQPRGKLVTGSEITAHAVGSDGDGDPVHLRYAWRVNGRFLPETGPVLSTQGLRRDDTIQVRVTASDGEDHTSLDSAPKRLANAPPRVSTRAAGPSRGGVLAYQLEAEDPDGDRPLRFRLLEAPEGMTISSGLGEIEWRPSAEQAGDHTVTVEVDDLHGGKTTIRFTATVGRNDAEQPATPAAPGS